MAGSFAIPIDAIRELSNRPAVAMHPSTTESPGTTLSVQPHQPDPGVVRMVLAISRGDTRAFAEFYESWFDRALDLARACTRRDEAACLDIVQDSMMKAVRTLRPALGIQTRESLDAWMSRVVKTTSLDALRKESRRHRRERASSTRDSDARPEPASRLETDELIRWLSDELGLLAERDTALVTLRFGQGRTIDAVGTTEGMTTGAAHGRLRRLIDRFRARAKEHHHDG